MRIRHRRFLVVVLLWAGAIAVSFGQTGPTPPAGENGARAETSLEAAATGAPAAQHVEKAG